MEQVFPSMFKRGRNTILEWKIKVIEFNKKISIMMTYGTLNGSHAIRYQNDIKGKNKGKVNQTTPFEQAVLEAESKIRLRQKEGYVLESDLMIDNAGDYFAEGSLEQFLNEKLPMYNTDVNGNEIPMKCQQYYRSKKDWLGPDGVVYDDRKSYYMNNPFADKKPEDIIIAFPCYIQPKVNGVRAFLKMVNGKAKLFSKKGLDYNLPHITEWFEKNQTLFDMYDDDVIFDGELYIEGESLQNIASAVKAYQINTLRVKYHVFDTAIEDMPQDERYAKLYSQESKYKFKVDNDNEPVVLVPTKKCINDERAQILTDEYITQGYEGAIFRDMKGLYEFGKRPKTITKLKRMMDAEFLITDVIATDKDDTVGLFVCVTPGGASFKVNPKGTTDFKRSILNNREGFIGKSLTCFFYEYTDDMIPFHINDNIVRDYE